MVQCKPLQNHPEGAAASARFASGCTRQLFMFKESSKRKLPQFTGSVPSSHLLASASCETQNLLPQQKAQRRRFPAFEGTLYDQPLNMKPVCVIFTWSAVTFYASNGTRSTVFPTGLQDGKLLMVSSSIYHYINTKAISNSLSIFFNFLTTT